MEHVTRNAAYHLYTNNLWITTQLWLIQARKCIQQHFFQIPEARQVFRVL